MTKFEFHDVSSEGARFVGENIADLAKLFVKTGRGDLRRPVSLLTVHQSIILHKLCLHYLHHLDCHNE